MIKKIFSLLLITLLGLLTCGYALADQLRDGDIIFQTSQSVQSIAIQKATHSKYSHMGIIFFRDGKPYVYEVIKTVQYTPFKEWVARREDGHYVIKRLSDADRILTTQAVAKLLQAATRFQGKPYDLAFEWSDERMYCSELVWKIYDRGIGIQLGGCKSSESLTFPIPLLSPK